MRNWRCWLAAGCAVAMAAGAAAAQEAAPVLRHTFDEDTSGWNGMGTNARVTVTQQSSFNGKGCLKFEYDIKQGSRSMLVLGTPDAMLARVKAFRFWVNADYPAAIAVIMQEQDGGRYTATFAAPKGRWQEVALSTADFSLAEGPDDPKDPDNQLDMDKVASIAIVDICQAFGIAENPEMAKVLNVPMGAHTLLMDDFTATAQALPATVASSDGEVRFDAAVRPQVPWLAIGGATLTRIDGKSADERGLQADYRQEAGRLVAMMRPLPRGKLQGLSRLSFTASASRGATILVQLEEAGGGKFNTTVTLPDGGAAQACSVAFTDLTPGDDSKVKDRKVKPELVSQLVILDATGMMGAADGRDSTLRITGLRAGSK